MRNIVLLAVLAVSFGEASFGQTRDSPSIDDPAALAAFRSGQQAFRDGKLDVAEEHFREAIAMSPRFAAAHCALGQARMAQRRYAEAVGPLEECKSLSQSLASTRSSAQASQDREVEEEIQELRRSIDRIRSGEIKSGGEMMITKIEQRLRQLEEGRRRGPTNALGVPAEIPFTLGTAYFRTNRLEAAERELQEALNANPKFGEAHNNLAAVYAALARWDEAAQHIEMAERAGFKVNDALKADVAGRRGPPSVPAASAAPPVTASAPAVISIAHSAIPCVSAIAFPRIEADISSSDVVAARVFFRTEPREGWYAVRLRQEGNRYVAILPRPRSTRTFRYYLEAASPIADTARTPEHVVTVARDPGGCAGSSSVGVHSASGLIVEAPAGHKGRPVPRGFSARGIVGDIGQFDLSPAMVVAGTAVVTGGAVALGLAAINKEPPGIPPVGEPFVSGPGIAFVDSTPPPGGTLSRSTPSLALRLRIFSPTRAPGAIITAALFTQTGLAACLLLTTTRDLEASRSEDVVLSGPERQQSGCTVNVRSPLAKLTVSVAGADQHTLFETGQPGIPHIPITFEWGE